MRLKYLNFGWKEIENIVRNGENAGFQHFLIFPQFFRNLSILVIQSRNCVVKPSLNRPMLHPFFKQYFVRLDILVILFISERGWWKWLIEGVFNARFQHYFSYTRATAYIFMYLGLWGFFSMVPAQSICKE